MMKGYSFFTASATALILAVSICCSSILAADSLSKDNFKSILGELNLIIVGVCWLFVLWKGWFFWYGVFMWWLFLVPFRVLCAKKMKKMCSCNEKFDHFWSFCGCLFYEKGEIFGCGVFMWWLFLVPFRVIYAKKMKKCVLVMKILVILKFIMCLHYDKKGDFLMCGGGVWFLLELCMLKRWKKQVLVMKILL